MAQMICWGPFGELDRSYQARFQPSELAHIFGGQALAPPTLVYCHRKLQRREELGASARIHLGRARPSGSRMRRARTLGAKPERSMEPLHTGELGLKCKAGSQLRQR